MDCPFSDDWACRENKCGAWLSEKEGCAFHSIALSLLSVDNTLKALLDHIINHGIDIRRETG